VDKGEGEPDPIEAALANALTDASAAGSVSYSAAERLSLNDLPET
jgi:hypothetical protein